MACGEIASSPQMWDTRVSSACPQETATRLLLEPHESSSYPHTQFSKTDKCLVALRIQSEPGYDKMTDRQTDIQICVRTLPVCKHLTFPFHVAAYVRKWKVHSFKGHFGVLIN